MGKIINDILDPTRLTVCCTNCDSIITYTGLTPIQEIKDNKGNILVHSTVFRKPKICPICGYKVPDNVYDAYDLKDDEPYIYEVDPLFARLTLKLNILGYRTIYSCQGHKLYDSQGNKLYNDNFTNILPYILYRPKYPEDDVEKIHFIEEIVNAKNLINRKLMKTLSPYKYLNNYNVIKPVRFVSIKTGYYNDELNTRIGPSDDFYTDLTTNVIYDDYIKEKYKNDDFSNHEGTKFHEIFIDPVIDAVRDAFNTILPDFLPCSSPRPDMYGIREYIYPTKAGKINK